jgi:hypothetical protein
MHKVQRIAKRLIVRIRRRIVSTANVRDPIAGRIEIGRFDSRSEDKQS